MKKSTKKFLAKKNRLRIAQVAPLWFTIPPQKYGGIERVISFLTEELLGLGHKVTLFAAPGSQTKAKLVSVCPKPLTAVGIPWNNQIWNLRNLSAAYEMADKGEFDIVHNHLDLWSLFFMRLSNVLSVQTMHNPLYRTSADATKNDRLRLFNEYRKDLNLVFISKSAQKNAGVRIPKSQVIYNGIDISHFKFSPRGGDYFAWIARINKHKGIENAIVAAEKAGIKLLLAGRLDLTQVNYFKTVIKPHLNKKIQYIGELNEKELSDFYGGAKALLYPIEWEEPFGLVVAEAMACGTPVIAFRRGSMPELIVSGKTGFVVNSNIKELVGAIKQIEKIDRIDCRRRIENYFTKEIMTRNYEKLYYKLLESN